MALPVAASAQTEQYRAADGRVFQSLRDTGVVRAARRAYQQRPTLEGTLALGAAQSSVREYRQAIETYSQAIRRWPEAAVLYRWRGHRRLTTRDFIRAKEDLQVALSLDSLLYGAWYHLGVVEFVNGDFDAAAVAFRHGIDLAPDPAERAGSTDWLWPSLARGGRLSAADSVLRARPDSIPAGNAYETRLRLYRGEIGPDAILGAADTAAIQRATLAFGVASWLVARDRAIEAHPWFVRAAQESDAWPSFGAIAAEAELAGRTRWQVLTHAARTVSACLAAMPASALRREIVDATLWWPRSPAPDASMREFREQMGLAVQEIAAAFRAHMGTAADKLPEGDHRFTWRQRVGEVVLTARRSGGVSVSVAPSREAAAPGERAAAEAFARIADSTLRADPALFVWPAGLDADTASATISLDWTTRTGFERGEARTSFPVFTVMAPTVTPVAPVPGTGVPRYPDAQRYDGIVASVVMEFVVNSDGRVVMSTVRQHWRADQPRQRGAMADHYDAFRQAILEVMPEMRFSPARIGGCAVPQFVRQPFEFALAR